MHCVNSTHVVYSHCLPPGCAVEFLEHEIVMTEK